MNILQFLMILKARKLVFISTLVLTVGITSALSIILPKQFEANSSIIFEVKGNDPISGYNMTANLMPSYMTTQVSVIQSRKVALKVVEKLGLNTNSDFILAFTEQNQGVGDLSVWIADNLLQALSVQLNRETSIVSITFESQSPVFAASVANAFAEEYINTNIELKVAPSRKAAEWFTEQVEILQKDVTDSQEKLTQYEREKEILFGDSRFDVETARLNQLNTALLQSESLLFDLQTRMIAAKEILTENAYAEFLDDKILDNLKVQLTQAEANFAEVEQRLSRNHPDYKSASAELTSLKSRFTKEVERVQARLEDSASREEKRLEELKTNINAQREKILQMNSDLDQREVLSRNVEVAKQVLFSTMERLSISNMQGQVEQADVAILTRAITPTKHTKPKVIINVILSIILGSIMGFAFTILTEILNRKVRTKEDIEDLMDIPVLVEISEIKPVRFED